MRNSSFRYDWSTEEILALFDLPFNDLMFKAHQIHQHYFNPNAVQISSLLSIKTGACPEDCAYCPQSVHHDSELQIEDLISVKEVKAKAKQAKANGASRFCMGAAWKKPHDRHMDIIESMISAVQEEGLETCVTLGMLEKHQAERLKHVGLDYYNHNIDTSPEYYGKIITTRDFNDRIETLAHIRKAGVKVCSGGIIGMGETRKDRARMLESLANLPEHPQSVPINQLVQVEGTPLHGVESTDSFEFIRTIAVARILMPASMVRLSAGREAMEESVQAWCFFAGANSIFYGEKLLTTDNPDTETDQALFAKLGLKTLTEDNIYRHAQSV